MIQPIQRFTVLSRVLHWLMALLILATLFVGIGMVGTVSPAYARLLSAHRSMGMVLLVLVAVRLINRLMTRQPALPADLPAWQQLMARTSHYVLYTLMVALPLVGWSMLSAGGYPVRVFGVVRLPAILPQNVALFAVLRESHTILGLLLFAVFLAHLGAALFHALIRRDDVLKSMTH